MSHPYRFAVYQRNRRAVLDAAGWRCTYCGGRANTADHVVPLVLGGSHDLANLVACCRRCNSRRGAQLTNDLKAAGKVGARSRRW
jgi:5-methylcytosine-specific restriction endonuclease McrA